MPSALAPDPVGSVEGDPAVPPETVPAVVPEELPPDAPEAGTVAADVADVVGVDDPDEDTKVPTRCHWPVKPPKGPPTIRLVQLSVYAPVAEV